MYIFSIIANNQKKMLPLQNGLKKSKRHKHLFPDIYDNAFIIE